MVTSGSTTHQQDSHHCTHKAQQIPSTHRTSIMMTASISSVPLACGGKRERERVLLSVRSCLPSCTDPQATPAHHWNENTLGWLCCSCCHDGRTRVHGSCACEKMREWCCLSACRGCGVALGWAQQRCVLEGVCCGCGCVCSTGFGRKASLHSLQAC